MGFSQDRESCVLLCIAYPHRSSEYNFCFCMAGWVAETEAFRRLYPIPWRSYQKIDYQVGWRISYETRETADTRPESRKINPETVKVHKYIDSYFDIVRDRCTDLCGLQSQDSASLGIIKPRIKSVVIESTSKLRAKAAGINSQTTLDGGSLPVDALPCRIKIEFSCGAGCRTDHKVTCEDKVFCEQYWNWKDEGHSDRFIEYKFKQRLREFDDLHFMVGTHSRWKSWLVISVLSPEKY